MSDSGASLFAVAPLDVDGEVSQLTLDRQTLLRGIMQGFARCYDLFEPQHAAPAAPQLIRVMRFASLAHYRQVTPLE